MYFCYEYPVQDMAELLILKLSVYKCYFLCLDYQEAWEKLRQRRMLLAATFGSCRWVIVDRQ